MTEQNNKYTEKMVTKAIIDKLSSIMIRDSIAKQAMDEKLQLVFDDLDDANKHQL